MRRLALVRPLALGLPTVLALSACSTLMVGELGYTNHEAAGDGGLMHGATGGYHMGLGFGAVEIGVPHGGMGFSGRFRSYGTPYSTIEPGIHGYGMLDLSPSVSTYLRGTGYAGVSFLPDCPGVVISPVLQPGALFCAPQRLGWCFSPSATIGYDIAPKNDEPGWTTGLNLGIGWGNVYGQ